MHFFIIFIITTMFSINIRVRNQKKPIQEIYVLGYVRRFSVVIKSKYVFQIIGPWEK